MLLLCQIHQCIKTSPVKNGWAKSRQNLQFGRFSRWETTFVVMCSVYIFSIPPLPSEVCLSTRGFQFEKQGKLHKEKGDPVLNWKGKVFRLVLGVVSCPPSLSYPILWFLWWKPSPASEFSWQEAGQRSRFHRSWDSALSCMTAAPAPIAFLTGLQPLWVLVPLPAPLLHLLRANHPLVPSECFPAGEHLSSEKWAKSIH